MSELSLFEKGYSTSARKPSLTHSFHITLQVRRYIPRVASAIFPMTLPSTTMPFFMPLFHFSITSLFILNPCISPTIFRKELSAHPQFSAVPARPSLRLDAITLSQMFKNDLFVSPLTSIPDRIVRIKGRESCCFSATFASLSLQFSKIASHSFFLAIREFLPDVTEQTLLKSFSVSHKSIRCL